MAPQTEIATELQNIIPADLWEKYSHLSFAEMAEIPELEEWADELIEAEAEWFSAE